MGRSDLTIVIHQFQGLKKQKGLAILPLQIFNWRNFQSLLSNLSLEPARSKVLLPISFCAESPIWKWLLQDLYQQLHQPYYLRELRNL